MEALDNEDDSLGDFSKPGQPTVSVGVSELTRRYTLLLQTIQVVTDAIRMYTTNDLGEQRNPATSADGGAIASLEAIHIHTCNRLIEYLEHESLWKVGPQLDLYSKLLENEARRAEALQAQTRALEAASAPSVMYRPNPISLPSGQILVYYGPEDEPENWIVGIGNSLEEAMKDFDIRFRSGGTLSSLLPKSALKSFLRKVKPSKSKHAKSS